MNRMNPGQGGRNPQRRDVGGQNPQQFGGPPVVPGNPVVGAVPGFDGSVVGAAPILPDPSAMMGPILNANGVPANIAELFQPNGQVN